MPSFPRPFILTLYSLHSAPFSLSSPSPQKNIAKHLISSAPSSHSRRYPKSAPRCRQNSASARARSGCCCCYDDRCRCRCRCRRRRSSSASSASGATPSGCGRSASGVSGASRRSGASASWASVRSARLAPCWGVARAVAGCWGGRGRTGRMVVVGGSRIVVVGGVVEVVSRMSWLGMLCNGVLVIELDKWMVNGRLIRWVYVCGCSLSVKNSEKL